MVNTVLPYLEFHLTDHCNLNCKGCTHYCPIAAERYLSMTDFLKDMQRLTEIFSTISRIRIMGGEPLLHPAVAAFAKETRNFFPASSISIVTNGILLPAMSSGFYETLLENNIVLDISVYPATKEKMRSYLSMPGQYQIAMRFLDVEKFNKFINDGGDSDQYAVFRQCQVNRYCTFLLQGKIYHCCMPALSSIINNKFGTTIPGDDCIDIHTKISAGDILSFLLRPSSACAWCRKPVWFPWQVSTGNREEWIIDSYI